MKQQLRRASFLLRLFLLPKQTHPIAAQAVKALTEKGYPTKGGYCQMWVRLVIEWVCGLVFWSKNPPDAIAACHALQALGFEVPKENGSVPGDLLFKLTGSGGFGHVGIRVAGNMVAENSSVHDDDDGDARGLRTLAEFGDFDVIIRIPPKFFKR